MKDVRILFADGGDPHMPRQDNVAGEFTVISIDDGVQWCNKGSENDGRSVKRVVLFSLLTLCILNLA